MEPLGVGESPPNPRSEGGADPAPIMRSGSNSGASSPNNGPPPAGFRAGGGAPPGIASALPSSSITSQEPLWQQVHCSGDVPAGRIGHTMCTSGDETTIILYGGVNETDARVSQYLDDLYCLDFASSTWRRVEMTGNRQQPRAFHTAVMYNDLMYIFGGCNGKGRFNKVFTISRTGECNVVTPNSPMPATRYCHSAVLMEHEAKGTLMYIFAGKCGGRNSNKRLSDVFSFRLATNEWEECPQYGDVPPSRSAHAAFTFGRSMIIFGGRNAMGECCEDLYDYCYDTCVWRQIITDQGNLIGRARHSVVLHNNVLIVFGGWNGRKKLNDMFLYNLETETFDLATELSTAGAPSRRECHVAVTCRNTMVVFAGRFRGEFMNDTFHMRLEPKSLKANCRDWLLAHRMRYDEPGIPERLVAYVRRWHELNTPQPRPPQSPVPPAPAAQVGGAHFHVPGGFPGSSSPP